MADDQALFERIWYAARDGRVEIGTDLKRLNRPGSPVFSHAETLSPWLALVCLTIAGWLIGGWIVGLAVLFGMLILIGTTINFIVLTRLRNRALAYAMSGLGGFISLWEEGALTLRLKDDEASEIEAPDGDWRSFVSRHLPEQET